MLWHGEENRSPGLAIWCWLYAGYPHFPWGESGLCSLCLSRSKSKAEAGWQRDDPGFVDVLYCCHGRICFSTRTESERELWEDGFYFEVFPPIVHYCRELLPREPEVSKKGVLVFFCRARKQTGSRKAIDIHLKHNISYLLRLIKRYINRPTEFTHNTCRFAFKDQSGSLGLARCAILCFPG